MFSLLENGWKDSNVTGEVSLDILKMMIKYNSHQEDILKMHQLERGSYEYDAIKEKLPCVKPHGTFNGYCNTANFKQVSGYIFFDIDKGDIQSIKHDLLTNHTDKIALLGQSVGGKGIFFYVKIANKEILTPGNFLSVQNYLINTVFSGVNIDLNAKGINRNQVIPYDANLFCNDVKGITIPVNELINYEDKGASSCNKKTKERNVYTTTCTFLGIEEVNKHIVWKTSHDIGDADYVISDVQSANLFIPRIIKDGSKHAAFKAMVNVIMFNNPKIEYLHLVSFINFINSKYTGGKPMKVAEMIFTVKKEFERIQETGEIYNTKTRHVITNKNLSARTRQALGAKGVGEYKVKKSKDAISKAVEILREADHKVTQETVAELLTGRLSLRTVKKYWSSIVTKAEPVTLATIKHIDTAIEPSIAQGITPTNENSMNEQDETKIIKMFDENMTEAENKEAAFKVYQKTHYSIIFPKTNMQLRLDFEDEWAAEQLKLKTAN